MSILHSIVPPSHPKLDPDDAQVQTTRKSRAALQTLAIPALSKARTQTRYKPDVSGIVSLNELVVRLVWRITLDETPTLLTNNSYRTAPVLGVQLKVGVLFAVAPGEVRVGRGVTLTVKSDANDQLPEVVLPIGMTQTR